ncbi:sensor histidine kinase [Neolewinella aurantiaca]|uniref:histidine kinase n=2 Tax=Neolewinella aurantiaca TaxID=2602767 RepID=A0A5C7F6L7_9BACT|nr:sensor histidine kinase [Neolewinella aurantiaca]
MAFAVLLHGQSSTEERLDSILATPADTSQVRALIQLSYNLAETMSDIPDRLYDRGIELGVELKDYRGLANLYSELYINCLNNGDADKGLPAVAEAIRYAGLSGLKSMENTARVHETILLMMSGATKKASEKAAVLAKQFRAEGNVRSAAEAYYFLSTLSSGFGDKELTLTYDSLAVALARESEHDRTIASATALASINFSMMDLPEKALAMAEESVIVSERIGSKTLLDNALSARALANTTLGNYDRAYEDYNLLQVGEGDQKSPWRMTNKGVLLQRTGRHEEARELILEAINILKQTTNDPVGLSRSYMALQTVGLNEAQYDTVVWYGKLMKAQADSLQAAENIRNLREMEEIHKTEEKEREILDQQKEIANKRIQLIILFGGLLVALAGVLSYFLLSRRLKKKVVENERLISEKELLVSEIHHRVKNNLQVISSLLQLQRGGLEANDEKGREALLESQNRVSSMGLIHNKLYQGTQVTAVNMPDYIKDLGETLLDAYRLEEQVEIFYDVEDMNLDVDLAIPLGLIINELVTNSLKYAFPGGREGLIEISLHHTNEEVQLAVTDDGVGVAGASKRKDSTNFGQSLIGLLVEKLKGSYRTSTEKGYGVVISFQK